MVTPVTSYIRTPPPFEPESRDRYLDGEFTKLERSVASIIAKLDVLNNTYAPLDSPVFTGDPTAPTPTAGDNDTSIATTAFVVTSLVPYATTADLNAAIAAEVTARNAAIAAASYVPASVANLTVQSNISGGSAVPAANTLTTILDAVFGSTRGSVLYRGASAWASLAAGTAGQFLKTNGTGGDPAWVDVPNPWTYIFKPSDQTITSSAALTDDTSLQIAVTSGQTLTFRVVYYLRPAGSYQVAINGPTASFIKVSAATSSGATAVSAYNSAFASSSVSVSPQVLEGIGKITFTASGTFTLRIAQGVSNATGSVFEAGSYLEYRLV